MELSRPSASLVRNAVGTDICAQPALRGREAARDGASQLVRAFSLLRRREANMKKIAGIDVHKKVLMVVIAEAASP